MDTIPIDIKKTIESYLTLLRRNNFSIKEAYLFGSYAKGLQSEWSDIDIALVSDIFEGVRIRDKDKIRRLTLSVSSSLEVVPFRPEDFSPDNPFAKEIIDTGIRLV